MSIARCAIAVVALLALTIQASAQVEPLASWNDTPIRPPGAVSTRSP
ncbi:hypothetical protein [Methylobacterium nigriterrae]